LKIDLSKFEVEMLDAALNVWEKEPSADAAMGGIMGVILSGISGRAGDPTGAETIKNDMRQMRSDAEKTGAETTVAGCALARKTFAGFGDRFRTHAGRKPGYPPPRFKIDDYANHS
jgi:hypothetical protein